MNTSPEIGELATALAKAQAAMHGAAKDSKNEFFSKGGRDSKYADLESIWVACRKCLTENGLSVIQYGDVSAPLLMTRLMHSSGQWIEGAIPVKAKDDGPQAYGSGWTYARRYALAAMVGVYATDDDAEAAQGRQAESQGPSAAERTAYTKKVNEYRAAIMEFMAADKIEAAADVMRECKEENEGFAADVWGPLTSQIKNRLRDLANAQQEVVSTELPRQHATTDMRGATPAVAPAAKPKMADGRAAKPSW